MLEASSHTCPASRLLLPCQLQKQHVKLTCRRMPELGSTRLRVSRPQIVYIYIYIYIFMYVHMFICKSVHACLAVISFQRLFRFLG